MIDLNELDQLLAFAELGTLSQVAEKFHISTPSVTRSMQHLEESFGVSLFSRGKNKIKLNETGGFAVEEARKLLQETDETLRRVRDFDVRRRTIVIRSCAPAPLWELLHRLNTESPGMMISSAICQTEDVLADWQAGNCDFAVLPFETEGARPFLKENLQVCVRADHELAQHESLCFADINGFNFLLRTELGFWDTLCRKKMPASKFLVQPEAEVFDELVRASTLPCFVTDYRHLGAYSGRIGIPITDADAQVQFYLLER